MIFDEYTFDFFNLRRIKEMNKAGFELLEERDTLKEKNAELVDRLEVLTKSEKSLKLLTMELQDMISEIRITTDIIKVDIGKALTRCNNILGKSGDDCKSGLCKFPPADEYFPPAE